MNYLRISFLCMLLVALTAGCDVVGDDDDELAPIEGTWEATVFTATVGGEVYDILDAGGELNMTLLEDGTVESGFFRVPCSIPGACEQGEEADSVAVSFEGTYDVDGSSVTFDHAEDTFVRGTTWLYDGETLVTETTVLDVVLER